MFVQNPDSSFAAPDSALDLARAAISVENAPITMSDDSRVSITYADGDGFPDTPDQLDPNGTRKVNGRIGLRVPAKVIEQHCQAYMVNGEPARRSLLLHDEDYTIIDQYQAEFRGILQYYLLAVNVAHLGKLQWVMEWSLAKTLAAKHKTTCRKVFRSYKSTVQTAHGPRKCLKVVKEQGGGERPLSGMVRWHTPEAETAGSSHRPEASSVQD